jgi:hypothetical protein
MSSYYSQTTLRPAQGFGGGLGVDQTQPGLPFVRDLMPTDIRTVTDGMEEYIRKYFPGFLNFDAIRLVGVNLNPWSDRIMNFVKTVVDVERSLQATLTRDNEPLFRDKHHEQHPKVSDSDVSTYFRAWYDMTSAGRIPSSISKPWDYTPTTLAQDIGTAVGQGSQSAMSSGLGNLTPLILGAIAVYAGVTVFLPKMLTGRK